MDVTCSGESEVRQLMSAPSWIWTSCLSVEPELSFTLIWIAYPEGNGGTSRRGSTVLNTVSLLITVCSPSGDTASVTTVMGGCDVVMTTTTCAHCVMWSFGVNFTEARA